MSISVYWADCYHAFTTKIRNFEEARNIDGLLFVLCHCSKFRLKHSSSIAVFWLEGEINFLV